MKSERKKYIQSNEGSLRNKGAFFASVAFLVVLGFAVYGNSLPGKFIWDDEYLVRDNAFIRDWSRLPKLFAEDIGAGAGKKYDSYRPVQMVTYMLDYSLWKSDVRGYHATNVALHILTALSLFWLIFILFKDTLLSLLTSALFLVHPVHTEAVTYISGRADILATLFILLCFVFYIRGSWFMIAAYVLALLSKENSIILPFLLLAYHYAFKVKIKARNFMPVLGLAVVYVVLRVTALKSLLFEGPETTTLWQRLPGFLVALFNYLRLLLLPFDLHMEYGDRLFDLADFRALAGAFILFSLLFYLVKTRKRRGLVFFCSSWFLVALLPVSNLYTINAYMAEHWLYLPAIGFFLIAADGLKTMCRSERFRTAGIVLSVSLLSFYSFLTVRQNGYWQEPISFYERTLKYNPNSHRVHYNLGNLYKDMNELEKARAYYEKAVALDPKGSQAYTNLGVVYAMLNRNEEALNCQKKAVESDPNNPQAYYNLGKLYQQMGDNEGAIFSYKRSIAINPANLDAYNNLGFLYQGIGREEEAVAMYKKALEIDPGYAHARDNLNNLMLKSDVSEAGFYSNQCAAYAGMGKNEEAVSSCQKALEIDPSLGAAHNNLAVIYFAEGRFDLAIRHCDKALESGHKVAPQFIEVLKPYRK